jgi:hypothetical protein
MRQRPWPREWNEDKEGAAMQFTVRAWNKGWRTWFALNANELTWTALVIGGVLLTAVFANR